jgi:hypothetical protein
MKYFKKLLLKYIGKIEYIVTITNTGGEIEKYCFYKTKDLDVFVNEINAEIYWMVEKIEKIKRFDFKYNKEIIHTPLWFQNTFTEKYKLDDCEYSFFMGDDSLQNIKRTNR